MKTKLKLIASASAASFVMVTTALSQETPNADKEKNAPAYSTSATRVQRLGHAEKASGIIGMAVENYQGEKLGKVNDLAVELETGRIVQAILSAGGMLGVGDTLVAVPPGALHYDSVKKVVHLNSDKEKLKASPKFDMTKWAECCEPNQVTEVYRYYGEKPYFTTRLGHVQKASKLMNASVRNLQDEKLGNVENFMVDLPAGRVVAVVLSSGGFIGIGDELSAVPPTAFRYNKERDTLLLDASKETLSSAPHFKSNQWPDLGQPSYVAQVYRSYRVEPYFNADGVITDADNSARNYRDRASTTLTPLDQGTSAADLDTTAQIRKEIIATKGMSLNARNVKIITLNGRVTLRGPVENSGEKRLIGDIAGRIVGADKVDNQLEVKLNTTSTN